MSKVNITLSVDEEDGIPVLEFTHDENSNELEQRLVKLFVKLAKQHGLKLLNGSGGCGSNQQGVSFSYENYTIKPNFEFPKQKKK